MANLVTQLGVKQFKEDIRSTAQQIVDDHSRLSNWPNSDWREFVAEIEQEVKNDREAKAKLSSYRLMQGLGVREHSTKPSYMTRYEVRKRRMQETSRLLLSRRPDLVSRCDARTLIRDENDRLFESAHILHLLRSFNHNLQVRTSARAVDDAVSVYFLRDIISRVRFTNAELADPTLRTRVVAQVRSMMKAFQEQRTDTIGSVRDPISQTWFRVTAPGIWIRPVLALTKQLLPLVDRSTSVELLHTVETIEQLLDVDRKLESHLVRVHAECSLEPTRGPSSFVKVAASMHVGPMGSMDLQPYRGMYGFEVRDGLRVPSFIAKWERVANKFETKLIEFACSGHGCANFVRVAEEPVLPTRAERALRAIGTAMNDFLPEIRKVVELLDNDPLFPIEVVCDDLKRKPKPQGASDFFVTMLDSTNFSHELHHPVVELMVQYLILSSSTLAVQLALTNPKTHALALDFRTIEQRIKFLEELPNGELVRYAIGRLHDNVLGTEAPSVFTQTLCESYRKLTQQLEEVRADLADLLNVVGKQQWPRFGK